jgi:hypothetical protein
MKLVDKDPHCITWLTESLDSFDWTAKAVPRSTTEFLVAATPRPGAALTWDWTALGSSLSTVVSVLWIYIFGNLWQAEKGKARRATSTGRTQGEGALRGGITVLTSDGSDLRQLERGENSHVHERLEVRA